MITLAQIVSDVKTLPTLPESVARISKAIRNASSEIKDFEKIIMPDPSLTTNLLRLCNSAYFGFTREITSVKQAISLMGINRVYELALSGAFSAVIPPYLLGYNIPSHIFWEHSVAVAIIAEVLGKKIGFPTKDQIFTAGLLHDIGKIILGPHLHLKASNKISYPLLLTDWELQLAGTDHTEVGSLLSQIWNLPESCEEVIRWHHKPTHATESRYEALVQLVSVADSLAHLYGYGHDGFDIYRGVPQELFEKFKLDTNAIDMIAEETRDPINQMKQYFANKAG
ncbi:HDOD domain-containing protein [bacterium]|nr:HDOD domain-containing protein [bacterium]